ncbi:pyridoxal phosphate-dependent transferase [Aspergillus avenaceus]|uniref:Pyridoxal phosphate-dependent transferase n=1 Tax=Aspergillus avenaceus TaxID=36643 RepID=A0A5N6TJA4_ASPAV|nr:pyridoxal phosphate-dependent transferase [Aspergillus avenaceus]
MSDTLPQPPLNLARGWPANNLFPRQNLQDSAVAVISNPIVSAQGLGYGPDEGHFELRKNIGTWLSRNYGLSKSIEAERICISGGASQNLACVLQVFTDHIHTRYVWLVEPIYHLAFRIFEDAGFYGRLRAVPEDENGINIDFLERAIQSLTPDSVSSTSERPYGKTYSHVIYCVPTFSNPSGTTMPVSRREALVRLARKHDALIIADDVYDFLDWTPSAAPGSTRHPLPRIVDIDRTLDGGPATPFGNSTSNGSFSKIVAPGCRVGWAEGTPEFAYALSQAGSTRSGGAASQLMSTFINDMLENGSLDKHIRDALLPTYSRRALTLEKAIKEHLLPLGVTCGLGPEPRSIQGGFFTWIKLPHSLDARDIADRAAQEQNLSVAHGNIFSVPRGSHPGNDLRCRIRLCFAWESEELISEGVERLALVLRDALAGLCL